MKIAITIIKLDLFCKIQAFSFQNIWKADFSRNSEVNKLFEPLT